MQNLEEEADGEPVETPACPACGGEGLPLGILGRLAWFRCRDCGTEFSLTQS